MLPLPPEFARSGNQAAVYREVQARQRAMTAAIDAGLFCAGNEADEEVDYFGRDRKSPALPRKSPALRSLGSRGRGEPPPTQILDYMYLGGLQDARDVDFLRTARIKKIINVSSDEYLSPLPEVEILWLKSEDTCDFDISAHFGVAEAALCAVRKKYFDDEARQPGSGARVLVHCLKGRSRSVTIVLAHVIRHNGWSVAEALQYVSGLREHVEPNLGFIEALRNHATKYKEKRSDRKMARGLVVCFPAEEGAAYDHFPCDATTRLQAFFGGEGLVVDIKARETNRGSGRPAQDGGAGDGTESEVAYCSGTLPVVEKSLTIGGGCEGSSSTEDASRTQRSGRPSQSSSTTSPQRERQTSSFTSSRRMTRTASEDVKDPPIAVFGIEFACHQSVKRVLADYEKHPELFRQVLGRTMLLRPLQRRRRGGGVGGGASEVPLE